MTPSRQRLILILLLAVVPCLIFPAAFLGGEVVSADDHLTVHPAFQDTPGGSVRHPQLSDPALQFKALRSRVLASLSQGRAPLWNPDIYAGAPLLANGQSMVGSPVTWARLVLPEDTAQDFGVWWILVWAGLGTGLVARRLRPDADAALLTGLVAGTAAMTTPYLHVWLLHPHAATACWIPWVILAIDARSGPGMALAVAGMAGGGHPGTMVHGALFGALWWSWRARSPWTVLGGVTGLLLAGPLLWPLAEQAMRSTTLGARGGNTLPVAALLDLAWPGFWGHPARGSWADSGGAIWADGQLHPGPVTLALALFSMGTALGRRLMGAWAACLVLSLTGLPGPFDHARLGSVATWLPALSAGLGAATLARRVGPRHGTLAAVVLVVSVVATGWWARRDDQSTLGAAAHDPAPAQWTKAVRTLTGCDGPPGACGRVLGLGWMLQPNTGALAGLPDLRGYDLPVSRDTHRLMAALNPRPRGPWYPVDTLPPRPLLAFAAVRAIVSAEPVDGLDRADVGEAPAAVHPLPTHPRAWLATAAVKVQSPAAALARVGDDPRSRERPPVEVVVPALRGQPGELPVDLIEDGPGRLVCSLPAGAPAGLVVVADAWAPGWRVTVDGVAETVIRVGGAFRGVSVPADAETVVFRYRPDGWIRGQRAFAAGVVALILLGLARRRQTTGRP